MTTPDSSPSVPFEINDWLIDAHNPAQQGQFTGRTSMVGPRVMVELRYLDGALRRRPLEALSSAKELRQNKFAIYFRCVKYWAWTSISHQRRRVFGGKPSVSSVGRHDEFSWRRL